MNPDTKQFEPIPDDKQPPEGWPVFKVGEPVEVNGVQFRIRKITNKDLVLRPEK